MLIKLTKKEDGNPMYVNSKAVVAFDGKTQDGVGCRIVFDNDFAYEFVESVEQVKVALKCHGLFCSND